MNNNSKNQCQSLWGFFFIDLIGKIEILQNIWNLILKSIEPNYFLIEKMKYLIEMY